MTQNLVSILFVCLGNICRSPMAEGIFKNLVKQSNLDHMFFIDSAGTAAYHSGCLPDFRSRDTGKKHGITLNHIARQIDRQDFFKFNYIIAMDKSNFNNVKDIAPQNSQAKLLMMTDFSNCCLTEIPDPYYGNMDDFEEMYKLLYQCCNEMLEHLK